MSIPGACACTRATMHIMASTARHDATRDNAILAGTRVFLYVACSFTPGSFAHASLGW